MCLCTCMRSIVCICLTTLTCHEGSYESDTIHRNQVAPAVVNIVRKDGADNRIGSGSGFIFDANGHILTNAHVVGHYPDLVGMRAPSATRTLLVTLQDGRQYDGTVVSVDRLTDLAVVKITDEEPLPAVQLGCSAGLRAGEWVVAVGSPLSLQNTVTHGIVSCVDRKAVELGLAGARTDFIQTDAAINVVRWQKASRCGWVFAYL